MGPNSPPVPKKLAERIWKGEYIDLIDLLPSQLGAPELTFLDLLAKTEKARPKKQITTIQEWALCFNTFMTIIAMHEPERIADLLAYSCIIIKATLDYDDYHGSITMHTFGGWQQPGRKGHGCSSMRPCGQYILHGLGPRQD